MKYLIDEEGAVTINFAPNEANDCTAWLMKAAAAEVQKMEEPPPQVVRLDYAKDLRFAKLLHATMAALCYEKWHDEVVECLVPLFNVDPAEERRLLEELRSRGAPR